MSPTSSFTCVRWHKYHSIWYGFPMQLLAANDDFQFSGVGPLAATMTRSSPRASGILASSSILSILASSTPLPFLRLFVYEHPTMPGAFCFWADSAHSLKLGLPLSPVVTYTY